MAPIRLEPNGGLATVLPPGGLTLVSSCSAESQVLLNAAIQTGPALGDMTFSGIFLPGLNRQTWLVSPKAQVLTFFMTPELKAAGERVEFLPLCYQDILRLYRTRKPKAALFMCSPPDAAGDCSFGTEVAFIPELWRDIPTRITHINPLMPRTAGDPGIPFSELTAYIEGEQPLLSSGDGLADPVADAIALHVAPFVENGATLQTGVGKIPDAVMRALTSHKDLRIHTGLMGDALFELLGSDAVADVPAVVGVAIGSAGLYAQLAGANIEFRPVSVTHGAASLGTIRNLTTINSAIEVDLLGQVHAELTPKGLMSGPGGATDFARGARIGEGVRIIALPASAGRDGAISRIVAPGAGSGPVSLSRMDVDVIVTEHGAADLRGQGYGARAQALIAIAPPGHRATLTDAWVNYAATL